jgi:hypothetical protein
MRLRSHSSHPFISTLTPNTVQLFCLYHKLYKVISRKVLLNTRTLTIIKIIILLLYNYKELR